MRILKRILFALSAVLLTLAVMVAAFYGIEGWRGARAWERAQRELAAQGESINPADFIPPPVPDEQNLAMIPLFAKELDYKIDPETKALTFGEPVLESPFREMPYGRYGGNPQGRTYGEWMTGHANSMPLYQEYYAKQKDFPHPAQPGAPGEDVLLALTKFSPVLDEIEAAEAVRPLARFPVNWMHKPALELTLPHYNSIYAPTGALRVRALAYLATGRHVDAARDLATAARLRAAIQPEPLYISHVEETLCAGRMLQPLWEGLAAREWTADELREIQTGLRGEDHLRDYAQTLRGERAVMFCRTMDEIKQSGGGLELARMMMGISMMQGPGPEPSVLARWFWTLYPRGWIDLNEANGCLVSQRWITGVVDLKARRVWPARVKAVEDDMLEASAREGMIGHLRMALSERFVFTPTSILVKTTRLQTACEQAETACALERYFLDHQAYPAKLEELVPAYLDRVPRDLIDGEPMRYRLTEDGRYRLYGIGWNNRDDDGTVAWQGGRGRSDYYTLDDREGDWVWQYTPIDPPPLPK